MKELKYSWSRVLLYMLFTLCHDCKWNTLSTFQNESLKISGHWWISIKVQMTWAFDKLKPASIWDCGYFFILTFMTFWQNFVTSSMLRIWHELLKYENKTEAISSTFCIWYSFLELWKWKHGLYVAHYAFMSIFRTLEMKKSCIWYDIHLKWIIWALNMERKLNW